MKGRKQRTGLKKEATAQEATKRGKLQMTLVAPGLKVADTGGWTASSTQSSQPTLPSSTCPRARQEKRENPPSGG